MIFFKNKQRIKTLQEQLENLLKITEDMRENAYLVGIEREGRTNKFIFMRNGKLIQIETIGMISDDLPEWKKQLLRK